MKNVCFLLNAFLIIALPNCTSLGMGRRPSQPAPKPARPLLEICIINEWGGGGCFDKRENPPEYVRGNVVNYICTNADDYAAQEKWIKELLER